MYSLETFKCCNKHNIYFLECMFCGLLIILSKSIVCISFKSFFSFMFNGFDIVNLIPSKFVYIVLC
jgi:hypothetical protein